MRLKDVLTGSPFDIIFLLMIFFFLVSSLMFFTIL